jgi:hypothetical protein
MRSWNLRSTNHDDRERNDSWKGSISGRSSGSSKIRNIRSRSLSPGRSDPTHGTFASQRVRRHTESSKDLKPGVGRGRSSRRPDIVDHPRSRSQRPTLQRAGSFVGCTGFGTYECSTRDQLSLRKSRRRLDVSSTVTSSDLEESDQYPATKVSRSSRNPPSRSKSVTLKRAKSFRVSMGESKFINTLRRPSSGAEDICRFLASSVACHDEDSMELQTLRRLCGHVVTRGGLDMDSLTDSDKLSDGHGSTDNRKSSHPTREGNTKVQHVMDLRNSWKEAESKVTKVTLPSFSSKAA